MNEKMVNGMLENIFLENKIWMGSASDLVLVFYGYDYLKDSKTSNRWLGAVDRVN